MTEHKIVSQKEWLEARIALLNKEKELTRQHDELCAARRELPWVKIEKAYVFDSPKGPVTLADLFEGRSQLIVQHFMFGPEWKEGCVGCSFGADHVDAAWVHLQHHDVSFAAVSRAPIEKIEPYRQRMGWKFRWVSSFGNDFNYDYHVSFKPEEIANGSVYYNFAMQKNDGGDEAPGISVFFKDEAGDVFHTYSAFGRGDELLIGAYNYLDLTPKGRNEAGPNFDLTDWVRHHDRYDSAGSEAARPYVVLGAPSGCGCDSKR